MDINYYKSLEPLFGSWHITKLIGEGSFGKVFEIERRDDAFGKVYTAALKVISIPQSQSEIASLKSEGMSKDDMTLYFKDIVSDVINEYDIMAKLKGDSHIVSCEDYITVMHEDQIGWDILIRMEKLHPLVEKLDNTEMTEAEVIKLGIDLCRGLESCQVYNIIHRDIKPENIFVTNTGNYKLGDFGIARTQEKTSSSMSRKGTYTYMAPEVYHGQAYGSSVDIYSIGIVMYRLLNRNRAPFFPEFPKPITYADKENAIAKRMKGIEFPGPVNASPALTNIILKASAYEPKQRYSSPTELREALENLQRNPGSLSFANDFEEEETVSLVNNEEEETVSLVNNNHEEETVSLVNNENEKEIALPVNDMQDEEETLSLFNNNSNNHEEETLSLFDSKEAEADESECGEPVSAYAEVDNKKIKSSKLKWVFIVIIVAMVALITSIVVIGLKKNKGNSDSGSVTDEKVENLIYSLRINDKVAFSENNLEQYVANLVSDGEVEESEYEIIHSKQIGNASYYYYYNGVQVINNDDESLYDNVWIPFDQEGKAVEANCWIPIGCNYNITGIDKYINDNNCKSADDVLRTLGIDPESIPDDYGNSFSSTPEQYKEYKTEKGKLTLGSVSRDPNYGTEYFLLYENGEDVYTIGIRDMLNVKPSANISEEEYKLLNCIMILIIKED